jgi:XTP/dITP diphosphohydrolase
MRVVLATANPDKARELAAILSAEGIGAVLRPDGLGDVEETGTTLEENAELKATLVSDATGLAAVGDDTGLFVEALDGAPGVYSARYAGEHATYEDNVAKLLDALGDVPPPRRARFETAAVLVAPGGRRVVTVGTVHGEITTAPRGEHGFGYDPVFAPDDAEGRTLAELDDDQKHALSHRGRALRAMAAALNDDAEARRGLS